MDGRPVTRLGLMSVPNVLATRYASPQMQGIWSPEAKIVSERKLWLSVLRAQYVMDLLQAGAPDSRVPLRCAAGTASSRVRV